MFDSNKICLNQTNIFLSVDRIVVAVMRQRLDLRLSVYSEIPKRFVFPSLFTRHAFNTKQHENLKPTYLPFQLLIL